MSGRTKLFVFAILIVTAFVLTPLASAIDLDDHLISRDLTPDQVGPIRAFEEFVGPENVIEKDDILGPFKTMPPLWPDPQVQQVYGDKYNDRAIFVHQDNSTYLDDLLYTAAIPAAVHWEGRSRHDNLIITDNKIRENGNLIGDWAKYLEKTQSEPTIDFIGGVSSSRKTELTGYFTDVEAANNVTTEDNIYNGASDIAYYYWGNQRQLGTDVAVLAYVPEAEGAQESFVNESGKDMGNFEITTELNASTIGWLNFAVNWTDTATDTDYRAFVKDPYVAHNVTYKTDCSSSHTNPTDNLLFNQAGMNEIGISPFYSNQPFEEAENSQKGHQKFQGTVGAGDGSFYPISPSGDSSWDQFGPVEKGQRIFVRTNWTASGARAFDTFIYGPGDTKSDDYLLEAMYDPYSFPTFTPEIGMMVAPETGYYNVSVHAWWSSTGGDYTVNVYWDNLTDTEEWSFGQSVTDTDPLDYTLTVYNATDDAWVESVTNGAVAASLNNAPLLYTAGDQPEPIVVQTLIDLGIENLVIIDPSGMINEIEWATAGFNVNAKKTDSEVFSYITGLSSQRGIDKTVVLSGQGGPWFATAALEGAYHGAPVPALNGPAMEQMQIKVTNVWWEMIQFAEVYMQTSSHEFNTPKNATMRGISDDLFGWLGSMDSSYNPNCGDGNDDGAPDTGIWDYSEDIDVIVVSPMNALKPALDRAINGKASVGRIPFAYPPVARAVVNREMLYWKVGFMDADNPDIPTDNPAIANHWDKAGWTFVSYTHDDGILDDDLGDDVDDDYCGYNDGGEVHLNYSMRHQLPDNASKYGKVNEFHTYYDNTLQMLEQGTSFWSHNDHGDHNEMPETGAGTTGMSSDPSDPVYEGPDPDTNGLIDEAGDWVSGEDWYYEINNLHSTFIVMIDCMDGASRLPEYYMRMGAVGVVGDIYSMYIDPSPVFADRLTRGIFNGSTFGESHRWGIDESSTLYSLGDPGPSDGPFTNDGFADPGREYRLGDSVQTLLYGDPDLVMISPTLFIHTSWTYDQTGDMMDINISVRNQGGTLITPSMLELEIDSVPVGWTEVSTGIFNAHWTVEDSMSDHILSVYAEEPGYTSPKGEIGIFKDYDISIPKVIPENVNLVYIGEMSQTIDLNATAEYPYPFSYPLTDLNTNSFKVHIYDALDVNTGIEGELVYNNGTWEVIGVNVSSLPEGNYHTIFNISAHYYPSSYYLGPSFAIEHILFFVGPNQTYDPIDKIYDLWNLTVISTYTLDGNLTGAELTTRSYELMIWEGGPSLNTTNIKGTLDYDVANGTFYTFDLDLDALQAGDYYMKLAASTVYTDVHYRNTTYFSIVLPLFIWGPQADYSGGLKQTLDIKNVRITTSPDPVDILLNSQITSASYVLKREDNTSTGFSGDLVHIGGKYEILGLNLSTLSDGNYFVEVFFDTLKNGNISNRSQIFEVKQIVQVFGPTILYKGDLIQTLDVSGIYAIASKAGVGNLTPTNAKVAVAKIYNETGFETGLERQLLWNNLSNRWYLDNFKVSGLDEGDYSVRAVFSFDNVTNWTSSPKTFKLKHLILSSDPDVNYTRSLQVVDVTGFKVQSSFLGAAVIGSSLAEEHTYQIINNDGDALTSVKGDLQFQGDTWEALNIDTSSLGEGFYYVECLVSYKTKVALKTTETFRVEYDLKVERPDANYNPVMDTIVVDNIKAYSESPNIGNLTDATATTMKVQIRDIKNTTILDDTLDYENGTFSKTFYNVSFKGIVTGTYYAYISFETKFAPVVSNRSYDFQVVIPSSDDDIVDDDIVDDDIVPDDDDDDDDDDNFLRKYWWAFGIGLLVFLIILIIAIVLIVVFVTKRKSDEEDEFDSEEDAIYCPECGYEVYPDEYECPECGADIDDDWGDDFSDDDEEWEEELEAPDDDDWDDDWDDDDEDWDDDDWDEPPPPPKKGSKSKGPKKKSSTEWIDDSEEDWDLEDSEANLNDIERSSIPRYDDDDVETWDVEKDDYDYDDWDDDEDWDDEDWTPAPKKSSKKKSGSKRSSKKKEKSGSKKKAPANDIFGEFDNELDDDDWDDEDWDDDDW